MSKPDKGLGASGKPDRAVVNGAGQAVSALRASVPSALSQLRSRLTDKVLQQEPRFKSMHAKVGDIDYLECALLTLATAVEDLAQAIETRRAETERLGAKHESAVGNADAPINQPDTTDGEAK